jgi:hypothetical protein
MNEPTRGELGKARRALKKLGELNASEARQREIVDYFRAKGIDLTAHSSRYVVPPRKIELEAFGVRAVELQDL